jgi:hypothetical protein
LKRGRPSPALLFFHNQFAAELKPAYTAAHIHTSIVHRDAEGGSVSNGTPGLTITVTVSNATVTVSPSKAYIQLPLGGSTMDVTWTLTGDAGYTFASPAFAWTNVTGAALPSAAAPSELTLTVSPATPPFNMCYNITVTNGSSVVTTGTPACLQYPTAWGYPDQYSCFPGETIQLHVSSDAALVGFNVYPITDFYENPGGYAGWQPGAQPLLTIAPAPIAYSNFEPDNKSGSGTDDWGWPQNFAIPTGTSWATGIYIIEIGAYPPLGVLSPSGAQALPAPITTSWVMFVIKPSKPTPGAMLYKWNINTIQAYNTALYPVITLPEAVPAQSTPLMRPCDNSCMYGAIPVSGTTLQLTMRRPASQIWSVKSINYDYPFVQWLQKQNFSVDYYTDIEIELDTSLDLLSQYAAVLFRGHDEYLAEQTYDNLVAYRNAGGNLVFLSGNTCCWRIHYLWDGSVPAGFQCDKGTDPLDVNGPDAWWIVGTSGNSAACDNALVGAGSRNAGITGDSNGDPFWSQDFGQNNSVMPSAGFTIQNASHWIFAGSDAADGQVIGTLPSLPDATITPATITAENLIGYESNGVRLNSVSNLTPTFVDGTPANFALLGVGVTAPVLPATNGAVGSWEVFSREGCILPNVGGVYAATMGMYSSYGSVFTGSTINWVFVLDEMDANGGFSWLSAPPNWPPQSKDADGNPILGDPSLHYITRNVLTAFSNPAKNVVAAADLTGSGDPDLILQSAGPGEPLYWLMNGLARTASGSILYDGTDAPGQTFRIAAAAGLTGTGAGLLLQSSADGSVVYWSLDWSATAQTLTRASVAPITPTTQLGTGWRLCTAMPASAAGSDYLLFQNQQDGSLWYWEVNGTDVATSAAFGDWTPGNLQWQLVAAVDLTGSGVAQDLVFWNAAASSVYYWTMSGLTKSGEGTISGVTSSAGALVAAGSFGSPAVPTLIFQDPQSGALSSATVTQFVAGTPAPFTPTSNAWFLA